jgi:hydroxymethylglutaryl-CoA lyase
VEILEVGPRDGLQTEPAVLPTTAKVELVERLMDAGLRRIEVTSFVHPRKVPQMADAEEVLRALPRRPGVCLSGLVLNRKGLDRAAAAGCDEIGMVIVATDTFSRRNQGVDTADSIRDWLEIAAAARAAGVRPQVTISAAFGCPFEGEVSLERVMEIAQRAAEAEPHEICFADTIGVAVPIQVSKLLERARTLLPKVHLRCHFHNTRNTGLANAYAAVEAEVDTLDASLGGIGGCPFAPAATGNIPTEDLLYLLQRSGLAPHISLDSLIETACWMQELLGHPVPGLLMKAGPFPRSPKSTAATASTRATLPAS